MKMNINFKKIFLFYIASIAIAPPLYLLVPLGPIFRSIRLYDILFIVIFIFAFFRSTTSKLKFFYNTSLNLPVLGIFCVWILSLFNCIFMQKIFYMRDFFEYFKVVYLFLILQITIFFLQDREDVKNALYILITCTIYPQILGIFEHFHFFDFRRILVNLYTGNEYSSNIVGGFDVYGAGYLHKFRASSVFVGDVNAFGGYSALFFIMAFVCCMYIPKIKIKILFILIALLNLYGVLISGSRKSLVCVIIGILVFFWFKFRKLFRAAPLLIIVVLLVFKLAPDYYMPRFFANWEYKINNIIELWNDFSRSDLLSMHIGRGIVHDFGMDSFHLKILLRNGILGLAAHFFLIILALNLALYVKRNSKYWLDEMTGIMAFILIICMEWLNASGLYFYAGRISESYWVILGVLCVIYRLLKAQKDDRDSAEG